MSTPLLYCLPWGRGVLAFSTILPEPPSTLKVITSNLRPRRRQRPAKRTAERSESSDRSSQPSKAHYMSNTWNKETRDRKRAELEQRDGRVCGICGEPIAQDEQPTLDHIVPLILGGSKRRLENLQLAHRSCNGRRGHLGPAKHQRIS